MKPGSYSNSNMLHSMVMFKFSILDRAYFFWANLVHKITVICFKMICKIFKIICWIHWWCSFFTLDWIYHLRENLTQKFKIICLGLNLIMIMMFISIHCVKNIRIRSYSSSYFPAFRLNIEEYGVSLHIQSKCEINTDRNNSDYGYFLHSVYFGPEIFFFEKLVSNYENCNKNF